MACSESVKETVPCFVRLPDCRVYQVHVSKYARGQDCLDKVSSSSSAVPQAGLLTAQQLRTAMEFTFFAFLKFGYKI